MRIDSIHAIKNNEQHKQQALKNTGATTGKSASGVLFEEYLNAHIQKTNTPAETRQPENQLANLLLGYLPMLKVSTKSGREPESNVS